MDFRLTKATDERLISEICKFYWLMTSIGVEAGFQRVVTKLCSKQRASHFGWLS